MAKLQLKYKHICFEDISHLLVHRHKTHTFECLTNNDGIILGLIKWYSPWRQYCFFPWKDTLYAKSCLDDISHFINQLMEARKPKKAAEIGNALENIPLRIRSMEK